MVRILFLIVVLAAVWLLLSGYFDKPLLLAFGAGSVLFTAWLSVRANVIEAEDDGSVFPGIIGYLFWLVFEVGKANLMVIRQALAVEPQLSPKLFLVKNAPRTVLGKVIFGNSITLTPGTVTVDLREDEVLVHALSEDFADVEEIGEMGARVAKIEKRKGS